MAAVPARGTNSPRPPGDTFIPTPVEADGEAMAHHVTVATTEELPPGGAIAVSVDGEGIAVFNVDGEYHAVANACTHAGGSLGNGRLDGTTVTCPLHGARFDVTSGESLRPPAHESVRTYEVQVVGDEVRVVV